MSLKTWKKNYYYSDSPEQIPLRLKRGVRRLLKPGQDSNQTVLRNARWCRKVAYQHDSYVKRKTRREITSDTIISRRSYSFLSQSKDHLIETISSKHYYRFEEMLVIQDPFYQSPLTALAIFYTKEPLAVRYTVKGKTKETSYSQTLKPCREHRVPIFGLYAGRKNTITIELLDKQDAVIKSREIYLTTEELPELLKDNIIKAKHDKKSVMDMVMISGGLNVLTCAFDAEGDIRWYLRRQTKAYGVFPLSGGRFLYMEKWVDVPSYSVSQACMMYEMDYLGRMYNTYFYKDGFHHCAREMEPGGNILLGSNSLVDGYDENMVIELDRKTGEIVNCLNLNDLFDDTWKTWTDWVHVNSVCYQKEENSVIISMRNIHSVLKVDWETKELKWLLGHPDMWKGTNVCDKLLTPIGDIKWCFQQHAAYQLESFYENQPDTIQMIVYDNHWARRRPVDFYDKDEANSYLSIFTINERELTVQMEDITTVPNSRIRSNAILYKEEKRIFNMAGDLLPDIEGNKGMVEEYDFETKELLNRYFVKSGFFTAYPFEPDIEAQARPLPLSEEYWLGDTIAIKPFDKELDLASAKHLHMVALTEENKTDEDGDEKEQCEIFLNFQEDMLFVKAVDHSISYIYFIGEQYRYYADLTGTYQTMDIFRDKVYQIPFWLKDLKKDTYQVYYDYKDGLYNSGSRFTVGDVLYSKES